MTDILTRSFEVRATDEETREVSGLAVPWGEGAPVGKYKERFEKGAFSEYRDGAILYFAHAHLQGKAPVGLVTEARETDDGLEVRAKVSRTAAGDEVMTLLRDGVLKNFSIGFEPVEQRDEDGVVVRTKANLRELSIVPNPAYVGALISEVRSEKENKEVSQMADEITYAPATDLVEVRSEVEDAMRRLAVVEAGGGREIAPTIKYRSLGEFVKGLLDGSSRDDAEVLTRAYEAAQDEMETRAYTGAQLSDTATQPAWINRDIKLVLDSRDVLNLFSKAPLPATGMSVTYPVFGSKSGDVAIQTNEGDDLNYLELITSSASAPVKTYGGWSQLTRQVIERSDIPYLNKVLDMQKISYAKITNGVVRTALTGGSGYNTGTVAFADKGKGGAWVDVAVAALADVHNNSTGLDGGVWVMGLAQFKQLASIVDTTGRPVFAINGDGQNTFGNVNLSGFSANIAGIPVKVDYGMSGTNSYIVNPEAITVMESGPWNLQDENIINLSKAFSIYGYLALTINDPKGVAKISHPAS